jgi:hypothetical protein
MIDTTYITAIKGLDVIIQPVPLQEYRDYYDSSLEIKWSVELEGRSWGIKSISPSIHSIIGELVFSKDLDEEREIEINTVKDPSWDIEIKQYSYKEYLCPSNVEIDFDEKRILVHF